MTTTDARARYHRIRRNLVLFICGLLFFYFAHESWSLWKAYHETRSFAERRLASYASALAEHAAVTFTSAEWSLDYVRSHLAGKSPSTMSEKDLFDLLNDTVEHFPQFGSIIIFDKEGTLLANSLGYPIKKVNNADRDYFKFQRSNTSTSVMHFSKPYNSRIDNVWRFMLSKRLSLPDGSFGGVVGVSFNVHYFNEFYRQIHIGESARIALFRSDAQTLIRSPLVEGALETGVAHSPLFSAYLPHTTVGHYIDKSAGYDKSDRLIAFRQLTKYPIVAAVSQLNEEIFASWKNKLVTSMLSTVILLVLAAALSFSLWRRLSDLERSESELRASEERNRNLVETSFDWMWEVDKNCVYTYASPRVADILGYAPEELIGITPFDLMPEEEAQRVKAAFTGIADNREPFFALQNTNRHKNGHLVILETSGTPIIGPEGDFQGYRGFDHDVTELKLMAETQTFLAKSGWSASGEGFFQALARYLAEALRMDFVCIDRLIGDRLHAQTVAVYFDGKFEDNIEYALKDTPCGDVVEKTVCCFPQDVRHLFPKDTVLQEMAAESYVGTTLWSSDGKPIGLIAVISRTPLTNQKLAQSILQMVADRAAGELERLHAEAELRKSEEKFSEAFRISPFILTISDRETGRYLEVNDAFTKVLGYTREEVIGRTSLEVGAWLTPEDRTIFLDALKTHGECIGHGTQMRHKNGSIRDISISAKVLRYEQKEDLIAFIEDVTEKKKLEAQLIQSRKMESVGRLAGGVAHDYNNMLAITFISLELIRQRLSPDNPILEYLLDIEQASLRSRDITRQLLAFSRKQLIAPTSCDLNALVGNMQKSLVRLIGEDIDIRFSAQPDLGNILIDPSQIDQILVNLAVNARDAMPNGGRLTIETSNVDIDEEYCKGHADSKPGKYVCLTVSDDGIGMTRETLANIFEPFFTTKEIGKGTGLGLATVYGIVKQNNGFIGVYSEVGHGASFRLFFPHVAPEAKIDRKAESAEVPRGNETILLVEDDEMLCRTTTMLLESLGYSVTAASSPVEALALLENEEAQFDLLLTDVVMPEMNGAQMRDKIVALRSDIKVLFMSGYTSDAIVHRGVLDEGIDFVQKPFSIQALARKIRDVLNHTQS